LFLVSFHPCLEIHEPSTGPHSSLQNTERAIERTHIARKVLCQVRIGSLLFLLPSTWNLESGTCERLRLRFPFKNADASAIVTHPVHTSIFKEASPHDTLIPSAARPLVAPLLLGLFGRRPGSRRRHPQDRDGNHRRSVRRSDQGDRCLCQQGDGPGLQSAGSPERIGPYRRLTGRGPTRPRPVGTGLL